jgi:hypothetical protein
MARSPGYKGGVYENGLWRFEGKEMVILQDYGDFEHSPPTGWIELDERLVYQNIYSRSLGIMDGKTCLILPHDNILDVIMISEFRGIFSFDNINAKRPYNVKFLIQNRDLCSNGFLHETIVFWCCIGDAVKFVDSDIPYWKKVRPGVIDSAINGLNFEDEEVVRNYKEYDKYITPLHLLRKGYSYDAENHCFFKNEHKIYQSGFIYFSTDKTLHDNNKFIWYKKDVL